MGDEPYYMLFGAATLMGGLLWLPLGQSLATVAYLFLASLTEGAAVRKYAVCGSAAAAVPAVGAVGVLRDRGEHEALPHHNAETNEELGR